MVLPALLMYFGAKVAQRALESQEQVEFTRPPPTAPPAELVQCSEVTGSSQTSKIDQSKYISGIVKDGYFYHNDKVLNLKNITILNICVCPLSETTDKTYSGKINIMSEKGSILKQEYNERVRWITLSGNGLDVSNATIKVKIKTGQSVALQYTVAFKEKSVLSV